MKMGWCVCEEREGETEGVREVESEGEKSSGKKRIGFFWKAWIIEISYTGFNIFFVYNKHESSKAYNIYSKFKKIFTNKMNVKHQKSGAQT